MSKPLRIVFMGTPELARTSLEALLASRHEVVAVVSQPDRPRGRGQAMQKPPVAELAVARGIPLLQPDKVGTRAFREWVRGFAPDLGVVAAFGHLLGERALAVPRLGCINVHASLLPRWRGASPITMAVLHGDAEAGVSIMQMDVGMDTGPWLAQRAIAVDAKETGETLHDKIAALGAGLMVEVVDRLAEGPVEPVVQPEVGVTAAPLLRKEDAEIDWSRSAVAIERQIRAYHPWPGTRTSLEGKVLRVLPQAEVVPGRDGIAPGVVLAASRHEGLVVQTGQGALALRTLQLEGRKALPVEAFLAGMPVAPGTVVGSRPSSLP